MFTRLLSTTELGEGKHKKCEEFMKNVELQAAVCLMFRKQ